MSDSNKSSYAWHFVSALIAVISSLCLAILVGMKTDLVDVKEKQNEIGKKQGDILLSMAEMQGNRFTSSDWSKEGTALWRAQVTHQQSAHPPIPTQIQINSNAEAVKRAREQIDDMKESVRRLNERDGGD